MLLTPKLRRFEFYTSHRLRQKLALVAVAFSVQQVCFPDVCRTSMRSAYNMILFAFAGERYTAVRRRAAAAIACSPGPQQQTRRTLLYRFR